MNAPSLSPAMPTRRSGSHVVQLPQMAEPGFIDLLLTLWGNRRLMIVSLASCLVLGGTVAALWPPTYAYATTIEIGTMQRGESFSVIEPPEAVVAKISNAFLPAIEQAHGLATATPGFTLNLSVKNPRGTGLLILTSKATEADQDTHLSIHRQLAERIREEHRRHVALMRTNLGLEVAEARRLANAIKDRSNTLAVRRSLIEEKRQLTAKRLQEIDGELARISANREHAGKSLTGQEQVLTLMMLDLQLTRERDRRDALQRELVLGLVEENDGLARDEAEIQRDRQDREGHIAAIEARIANLSETRIVDGPQRSQKPTGIGPAIIMAIALVTGVMVGIASAMLAQGLRDRRRVNPPAPAS